MEAPRDIRRAPRVRHECHHCDGLLGPRVAPVASLTWFQAQQMCANAGKALCTNEEWQSAVTGTPDPGTGATGAIPYGGNALDACNVNYNVGRGNNATSGSGTPANTLAHVQCVSSFGAYDMIGNVWEWTGDWMQGGPNITGFTVGMQETTTNGSGTGPWPAGYGDGMDTTWNLDGQAQAPVNGYVYVGGLPAVVYRGGGWNDLSAAGAFTFDLGNSPTTTWYTNGARCCLRGR